MADNNNTAVPSVLTSPEPPNCIGGLIEAIDVGSPAETAGLQPGWVIHSVDGEPLRDIIDWLWLTDVDKIRLEVSASGATAVSNLTLNRELDEPWGIEFSQVLFDGIRTCVNACTFCFLNMLPPGLRSSLYLRDDDYRLSFLQGNFVTLTNISDDDLVNIVSYRLSPLHISLHAVRPETRQTMMGRNAARGIEVLEALLATGIQVHAQIVLMPGVNDGEVLEETLDWVDSRPNIVSIGIVPYAYTRYAKQQISFGAEQANRLINQLLPAAPRIQLADEWFLLADREIPPATYYGDFPQYENGIGMVRNFIDSWPGFVGDVLEQTCDVNLIAVTGTAFAPILQSLIIDTDLTERLHVLPVKNDFFGGCVNVTGLLTATNIIEAFNREDREQLSLRHNAEVLIPSLIFNSDGLTLDGYTRDQLQEALGRVLHVVSY